MKLALDDRSITSFLLDRLPPALFLLTLIHLTSSHPTLSPFIVPTFLAARSVSPRIVAYWKYRSFKLDRLDDAGDEDGEREQTSTSTWAGAAVETLRWTVLVWTFSCTTDPSIGLLFLASPLPRASSRSLTLTLTRLCPLLGALCFGL
jgi:hypothetical protein